MKHKKKDSTAIIVACAIIFCLFSFLYIYCYQTPTLSFSQHVLSGGVTFYHPLISAIIITVTAYILQLITFRLTQLYGASHALTYMPSMLLLAFLSCAHPDNAGGLTTGVWMWFLPVIIAGYVILIKVVKQWIGTSTFEPFFSSRVLSINLLSLIVMMLYVVNIGNGDALFHRQIWAEKLLIDQRYHELSREGRGSSQIERQTGISYFKKNSNNVVYEHTDSTLTLLRFIAMSKLGTLPDSLFTQPVVGGTASLMRMENIHPYLFTRKFLSRTKNLDYKLCALLAEGDLDNFAKKLMAKYNVNDTLAPDTLPRHYREALVLYQHLRSKPVTAYSDPVLETDYEDMRNIQKLSATNKEDEMKMWQAYRNTYWYYYIIHKNPK